MDPTDFGHDGSAEARQAHAAHSHWRDWRGAVAAMGYFLRHSALRWPADFFARAQRSRLAHTRSAGGRPQLTARSLWRRQNHPHFRHAHALEIGLDER